MDIIDYGQKNSQITKGNLYAALSVRIEKLTAALYMVTDFLEDQEPIKVRLRSIGVTFVTLGSICKSENPAVSHNACTDIHALAGEAMSLISIAGLVGLISEMNAAVLKSEIDRIIAMTGEAVINIPTNMGMTQKTGVVLPKDFFDMTSDVASNTKDLLKGHDWDNGHQSDMSFMSKKKPNIPVDDEKNKTKKYDVAQKINRTNSILKLIKDKGEVTIKDITTIISDCSEKTVQRELGVLVEQGVLKRSGQKRWSKYGIA